MIVRTWHGIVPAEKAEAFTRHLHETGVAEAEATSGNLGVFVHSQPQEGFEHFYMLSYWTDMDAVRTFAGPAPEVAVTYPDDSRFGLISDPIVLHHEVTAVSADWRR